MKKFMPSHRSFDEWVLIESNKRINEKYYKLTFRSSNLSQKVLPGQFMNILIEPSGSLFLRRPFSYFRVSNTTIEVLYEILGKGTAVLANKKKGDPLKVMGPLGKPFTAKVPGKKKRVLIAGGVGVPPLVFLSEKYAADFLFIGTKSRQEVLPRSELKKVKAKISYSTNDGSYGRKGHVTVLLEELLKKESPDQLFIQTCGPKIMMRAVMAIACQYGIPGEASLDETMACGVGACLGCMVNTHQGWQASCVEGPVFPFSELVEI